MINLKPLNNFEFGDYVNIIYDIELKNKKKHRYSQSRFIPTNLYDKGYDFNFPIVNFPFIYSNNQAGLYMKYISLRLCDIPVLVFHIYMARCTRYNIM